MNSKNKSFPSKILLFGEDSIIFNSWGLAIPYHHYSGELKFDTSLSSSSTDDKVINSNKNLILFKEYLKNFFNDGDYHKVMNNFHFSFNLKLFEKDLLNHKMYFDSSIPEGFGVGSSGALVAAVFDRYGKLNKNKDDNVLIDLLNIFSHFEAHFHGKSSGLDPLISFLKIPILIKSKNECGPVIMPDLEATEAENKRPIFFFINTNRSKKTDVFVSMFMDKYKNDLYFNRLFIDEYIPLNDQTIRLFLGKEWENLYNNFYKISKFQYEHFSPMILPEYKELWKKGLDSNEYYFKLCGSGGGGLILGISSNKESVINRFKNGKIIYK
ncbi:MAG: mevalonate kinase [Oligoflexia bacterium]|nr:mevalonate kinase [Oligoflexia bacterium]